MASMNAMMEAMAKEQNELRERVDTQKAAREHALTLQEGMNQHMHQLTQMIMEMREEAKQTRARARKPGQGQIHIQNIPKER